MSLYHDTDAHRDAPDDLQCFHAREKMRESRRKVRELDCQFCAWCAVIFVLAVMLSIFR